MTLWPSGALGAFAALLVAACSSCSKDATNLGGNGGTDGGASAGTGGASAGAGGGSGDAGTAGAAGGRGGTSGSAGTNGAGGGVGGTGGRACEQNLCLRPFVCVRSCGAPAEYTGCCPCEAPLFDDYSGAACGDGGQGSVSYVGCTYIGGVDRIVIGKRDTARDICFNLDLRAPGQASAGLTLPGNYGLEWAVAGPASTCPSRAPQSTVATQVSGSVSLGSSGSGQPTTADINVTVSFGPNDAGAPAVELLSAHGVEISPACP